MTRYLIDTHVLIWLAHGDAHKVNDAALALLRDTRHPIVVSVASLWETAIKKALGKLQVDDSFFDNIIPSGYEVLSIDTGHLHTLLTLPRHHADPFDRLLVAQAMDENLTFVTADHRLAAYGAKIILA